MNRFGTPGLRTTKHGSWAQWYQERPIAKRPLSQMIWPASSKPIAEQALQHLGGVDARVPDVADLERRHEGERLGPVGPGVPLIEVLRWPAVRTCAALGRRAPRRRLSRDLAHHVRLLGAGHDAPALDPLPRPVVDAVAPGRVELDAVRRVGREQRRRRAVEEPGHVVGVGGVAAQQAVVAEAPELARLDVRLLGRLGDLVGVGEPGLRLAATEVAEQREQPGVVDRDVGQERAAASPRRGRPSRRSGRGSRGRAPPPRVERSTYRTGTDGSPRDQGQRDPGVAVDDEARCAG